MNYTNIKLIWRNLLKNMGITSINIFGLSVSLAVSTLIILFLQFEYSFDKSNSDQNKFYRLITTFKYPNSPESDNALSSPLMGPYLQRECGDIEEYLRVFTDNENFICRANGKETTIEKNLQADSSFFSFFNYPLLYGDEKIAFNRIDNILITRKISEDLFGKENPVGRFMEYTYALETGRDTTVQYHIAAVFDDLPANSHLQFQSLTPLDSRQYSQKDANNLWHGIYMSTYFRLRSSNNQPMQVASEFQVLLKKEMPSVEMVGLSLQAFADIHLDSSKLQYDQNNFQKSNRKYLQVLALIALFILLITSINFANLSTVLAMRRVREVGVRKSLGADGRAILLQFLGEAMLMSVIGGGLALAWVILLQKPFLVLLGRDIELSFSAKMILTYVVAVVLLGLLAGLFPAIQAARYSAV